MKIIIEKNYESMSTTAMQMLLAKMYQHKPNIAITAGATPLKMYELMIEHVKGKKQFSDVTFHNFDELPYRTKGGYGVTISNLKKMFFDPAEVPMSQVHILDEKNYDKHDDYLQSIGGLDLIVLGIGADGHFCGNLPGMTKFADGTVKVDMTKFPEYHDILLHEVDGDENELPEVTITMGPKAVMSSKELILFATGESKAAIIKKAFFGPVDQNVPSSILQLHPNLTVILDEAAASEIIDLI